MDTIAALATATGGAIAVIRLSGPRAIAIADAIFRPASGVPLSECKGYTLHYGRIEEDEGDMVDEVLVSLFRAPRSYTGEDMVEISAHASPYICRRILEMLISKDARMAEAGEFTVRAFLAGKMDLSQAEAVADIVASSDKASHSLAVNQMRGGYSTEFGALREELLRLASLLELELDFSEEDVTFADRSALDGIMAHIEGRVNSLISSFSLGNALKEGVPVAIVGEPNVGKSTLLNTLLKEDRAIVSDIPGTTRDVIEESITLEGVSYRFLDTAGIRAAQDELERMGIERTHASIARAKVILWVVDARCDIPSSVPFDVGPDQHICLIINKIDMLSEVDLRKLSALDFCGVRIIPISAKKGIRIDSVYDYLISVISSARQYAEGTIVSSTRHYESLIRASESLSRARQALSEGLPADILSQDIRQTLHHLGIITGEITTDEILNSIFASFCIGK